MQTQEATTPEQTTEGKAATPVEQKQAAPVAKTEDGAAKPAPAQNEQKKKSLIAQEPAKPATEGNADAAQGAPETYEWKAPDGQSYDAQTLQAFESAARKLNLSNDKAQSMLDAMAPVMHQRQVEQLEAQHTSWQEAIRAHPRLGGDNLKASQALAIKAAAIGTPALRELLNGPLGDHPDLFEFLVTVGKSISPDTQAGTGAASTAFSGEPSTYDQLASQMYPNDV